MRLVGAKHYIKKAFGTSGAPSGFSLAEVLAAMMIGAMVLVAVLAIYSRAERSAAAVTRKLDSLRLPSEVLQRIAEDLDGIISTGSRTKITIENKFKNGFRTARLTITRTMTDTRNNEQTLEKIIWQSNYDYESDIGGLILYRSHSGIEMEDKLLDKNKEDWERELFVPICTGITFFEIRVPRGEAYLDRWAADTLPPGIEVAISFAEPFKKVDGKLDVPDEEKITRTIAIDRTRKIRFAIEKREFDEDELKEEESVPFSGGRKLPTDAPKKTKEVKR
jgi:prepilin-type N-terminal cleavage/methylation domain-containing protein